MKKEDRFKFFKKMVLNALGMMSEEVQSADRMDGVTNIIIGDWHWELTKEDMEVIHRDGPPGLITMIDSAMEDYFMFTKKRAIAAVTARMRKISQDSGNDDLVEEVMAGDLGMKDRPQINLVEAEALKHLVRGSIEEVADEARKRKEDDLGMGVGFFKDDPDKIGQA